MPNIVTGSRFGRLMVTGPAETRYRWICRCDCGTTKEIYGGSLQRGLTRSCGCLRREVTLARARARRTRIVLPGMRLARLTAIREVGPHRWECACECGVVKDVDAYALLNGDTRSCGCLQQESRIKHGLSATTEHRIWRGVVQRCTNPRNAQFAYYGGRGITICEVWRTDFTAFLSGVGPRPPRHSLDRIDNAKGYEPGNVRWTTAAQQSRNMRRNRWIEFNGERLILTDWATRYAINLATLTKRLRNGWSFAEALGVEPV